MVDRFVPVSLPDGETLFVEMEWSRSGDIASPRAMQLEWNDLEAQIRGTCKWIASSVKGAIPDAPSSLEVEFGLKLSIETGSIISALAKTSGEASILLRMHWDQKAHGHESA